MDCPPALLLLEAVLLLLVLLLLLLLWLLCCVLFGRLWNAFPRWPRVAVMRELAKPNEAHPPE
jgi:hypothetical protein